MKAKDIIAALDATKAKLKKLGADTDIGGCFIVCPPEGDPITGLMDGTAPSAKGFYEYMTARMVEAQKALNAQSDPYMGVRGGIR